MMPAQVVDRAGIDRLIAALAGRGYQVIGPTVHAGAIAYGPLTGSADLPVGWTDAQEAGIYRLVRRTDEALFGYASGPHSPRTMFHPADVLIWEGERADGSFRSRPLPEPPKYALFGIHPCDLAAIAIQDKVFRTAAGDDGVYGGRRRGSFVVAVNCTQPGGTCFCDSMGTGPRATGGFDIALTEVIGDGVHYILGEAASAEGEAVLAEAGAKKAAAAQVKAAAELLAAAPAKMGRRLDTNGIKELLQGNAQHPHWDEVAQRCLTCANCTLVCPTCFCANVEDATDLTGQIALRNRRWDACFNLEFSYMHGGPLRPSTAARYRHWITHKLASWFDQFGTSGCVGCGRCITWCPVGIDITAEAAAIRSSVEVVDA